MRISRRALRFFGLLLLGFGFVFGCGFDETLREYLDAHFWLPFSKQAWHFERKNVSRISAPFAGMVKAVGSTPLAKLRAEYQKLSQPLPISVPVDTTKPREAITVARADQTLTPREKEEVDLIDAKIDMRSGQPSQPEPLRTAQRKLEKFLQTARTPEFLSEARGWLGYVHFLLGEQTAAGKIYLDELNRDGSNLSRETLLTSLRFTYGYDGGPDLLEHLPEYFDTPEHAAFAVQMATNPHWERGGGRYGGTAKQADQEVQSYARVVSLLESHRALLNSERGANALALLLMRTALRMGDPPTALKTAAIVPAGAAIREEPDFMWMLASAHFLSREYASAERPLLGLFNSKSSSDDQKAAAAYGLCGVYRKIGNPVEQIRFALWLDAAVRSNATLNLSSSSGIQDLSVYWAASGWDLNLLLDSEAPIDALRSFLVKYPAARDMRLVKYSLAVRLARENQYEDAAQIYESIRSNRRAVRMRRLAELYGETNRTDLDAQQTQEAKYKFAEYLSANPDRIYFNDAWQRFQGYALTASTDSRLTGEERKALVSSERKLKDDQEERWRAYLILREVVHDSGKRELGRKAAQLAIRCLRRISERFGRQDEIRKADIELSSWLRH